MRTFDALIEEKTVSYAKLGVDNMFEWPGYRDFFLDMATGAQSARLTHVSRLDVGAEVAAANFGLMFRGTYIYCSRDTTTANWDALGLARCSCRRCFNMPWSAA